MTTPFWEDALQTMRDRDGYREEQVFDWVRGPLLSFQGKEYLHFATNDYLGFASHPALKERAAEALQAHGVGAGASRLVTGTVGLHTALEQRLAKLKGQSAGLVFASGYHANVGVIPALVGHEDAIFLDRLSHASLVDGCRLSRAKLFVFAHNDMQALDRLLTRGHSFRRRLIVTESLFSMDGDLAPLPQLADLADHHGAMTLVDEAHATGVLGPQGEGAVAHWGAKFGERVQIDVVMGTVSKALGSLGGFVVGEASLIDYLRNRVRPFIYTTGLPAVCCGAVLAALDLLQAEPQRCEQLRLLSRHLRKQLREANVPQEKIGGDDYSPIITYALGEAARALEVSTTLKNQGVWVPAIRPPTVPTGTSRLRVSLMALHSHADLDRLAQAIALTSEPENVVRNS